METYEQLDKHKQNAKYWLMEKAEVMETGRNTIRYYPKRGKLTVHLPDYVSYKTGEPCIGKGVGIDLEALAESPDVLNRLIDILSKYKEP